MSWFQENPETSFHLIQKYSNEKNVKIIDVGGGNSNLTNLLAQNDYENLSILDISKFA